MNRVIVSGMISSYGLKLSYTEAGKPQTSFMVVCQEPGREGASYKTFVPVLIVGAKAEDVAETLEAGDTILLEGKLAYKAGKTKDTGKLMVTGFAVDMLQRSTAGASTVTA